MVSFRTIETRIVKVVEEGETALPCLLVDVEVPGETQPDSILLSVHDGAKLRENLGVGAHHEMEGKQITAKYAGKELVEIYK